METGKNSLLAIEGRIGDGVQIGGKKTYRSEKTYVEDQAKPVRFFFLSD